MDIKFHNFIHTGGVIISAKVKINNKPQYYFTPLQIDKRQALISLFEMIKERNPLLSFQKLLPKQKQPTLAL